MPERDVGSCTGSRHRAVSPPARGTARRITFERNPFFREWSHAAQPRRQSRRDRVALLPVASSAETRAVRARSGRLDLRHPRRRASCDSSGLESACAAARQPVVHRRFHPAQHARAALRRRARPAGAQLRDRPGQDRSDVRRAERCDADVPAAARGPARLPPVLPVHGDPQADGAWSAPDLARARRLVARSGTRGQHDRRVGCRRRARRPARACRPTSRPCCARSATARHLHTVPIAQHHATRSAARFQLSVDGDWRPDYPSALGATCRRSSAAAAATATATSATTSSTRKMRNASSAQLRDPAEAARALGRGRPHDRRPRRTGCRRSSRTRRRSSRGGCATTSTTPSGTSSPTRPGCAEAWRLRTRILSGRPMVTSEEIADVPLFASLTAADRERLSRACADVRLAAGEYAVHEGEERALFVVLEGHIEVVKVVDGIERVLGERVPGAIFGEVPITLGTSFPSGFRAAEPSRVMHVDVTRVLRDRRCRARRGAAGRRACAGAHRRAPGRRRGAAEAPRAPRRAPLGRGLLRSAPLSRSQPDHVRMDHAGRERRSRRLGWRVAAGRRSPRAPCGRPDARPPDAARGRRAARAPDERHRRGVRRGHRRRRARRSRCCGVRGVRGPAHDRDRAGGARRPGWVVVADRELPRLPGRRLRRRAQQARAAAGTPARRGDPRHAHDHRARSERREPFSSTAATSCAGARSSWPPA